MSKNFVFDDALNELAGIAKASDENLMDEIGAVRTEFANADDAVRVEFAAADDLVREEFATADNTVRSEFAAEDEAIRGELGTAQSTLQSAIDGKLDKAGGDVSGDVSFANNKGVYGVTTFGTSRNAIRITNGDNCHISNNYMPTRLYVGNTNADGSQGENGYYGFTSSSLIASGTDMGTGKVDLGTTSRRWKSVNAVDGNFSGTVYATNGLNGTAYGDNAGRLTIIDAKSASTSIAGGYGQTSSTTTVSASVGVHILCEKDLFPFHTMIEE